MSPALGYLDLQLDLPRNEGPTAEAARFSAVTRTRGVGGSRPGCLTPTRKKK